MTDREAQAVGPLAEWLPQEQELLRLDATVPGLIAERAATDAGRPAVYRWVDRELIPITYGELASAAAPVAAALAGRVEPGGRIAVWGRNSVEWIVLEYAVAQAGLVLAPFNLMWTDAEVRHALDLTTPQLIFVGALPSGDRLVERAVGIAGEAAVVDLSRIDDWASDQPTKALPEVRPEDPFLIQFTSGTTGRAKGATLSHRAAINGALCRNVRDLNPPDDVWLNPVPYHHIAGSCCVMLGQLLTGGAFVLVDRWDPEQVVSALDSGRITRMGGVPTMLIDLMDRLGDRGPDAGVRSVGLGGAKVPQSLVDRIARDLGAQVHIGYGQSECVLITATEWGDDQATVAETVGRPLAGCHVRIADPETGAVLRLGEPGEIQVRSQNMMSGYWADERATAEAFTDDGFLRTGDLGTMDERGYLTFVGRVRDVIIRGGENIYPAEVEEVLAEHPGVATAVLVGIDDERLGEQVAGVVVRAPGSEVTGEELAAFLRGRVARFKVPVQWRFVDQVPMTASGKVRRFVVRDETNAELGATSAAETSA